jgi:hypothetical protein
MTTTPKPEKKKEGENLAVTAIAVILCLVALIKGSELIAPILSHVFASINAGH